MTRTYKRSKFKISVTYEPVPDSNWFRWLYVMEVFGGDSCYQTVITRAGYRPTWGTMRDVFDKLRAGVDKI